MRVLLLRSALKCSCQVQSVSASISPQSTSRRERNFASSSGVTAAPPRALAKIARSSASVQGSARTALRP